MDEDMNDVDQHEELNEKLWSRCWEEITSRFDAARRELCERIHSKGCLLFFHKNQFVVSDVSGYEKRFASRLRDLFSIESNPDIQIIDDPRYFTEIQSVLAARVLYSSSMTEDSVADCFVSLCETVVPHKLSLFSSVERMDFDEDHSGGLLCGSPLSQRSNTSLPLKVHENELRPSSQSLGSTTSFDELSSFLIRLTTFSPSTDVYRRVGAMPFHNDIWIERIQGIFDESQFSLFLPSILFDIVDDSGTMSSALFVPPCFGKGGESKSLSRNLQLEESTFSVSVFSNEFSIQSDSLSLAVKKLRVAQFSFVCSSALEDLHVLDRIIRHFEIMLGKPRVQYISLEKNVSPFPINASSRGKNEEVLLSLSLDQIFGLQEDKNASLRFLESCQPLVNLISQTDSQPEESIHPSQIKLGNLLADRIQEIYEFRNLYPFNSQYCPSFSSFRKFEFRILTIPRNSLVRQTEKRVNSVFPELKNLCYHTGKFNMTGQNRQARDRFQKFYDHASKSKDTLFLLVIDECHYGINRGGQLSSILDSELCNLPNVCLLFVSATPENLFTACSRIPEIYRFDRTNSFPFYLQIGFGGPPSVDFRSKDWKNCIRDLNADPIQRNKFFSAFPFYGSFFFPDQENRIQTFSNVLEFLDIFKERSFSSYQEMHHVDLIRDGGGLPPNYVSLPKILAENRIRQDLVVERLFSSALSPSKEVVLAVDYVVSMFLYALSFENEKGRENLYEKFKCWKMSDEFNEFECRTLFRKILNQRLFERSDYGNDDASILQKAIELAGKIVNRFQQAIGKPDPSSLIDGQRSGLTETDFLVFHVLSSRPSEDVILEPWRGRMAVIRAKKQKDAEKFSRIIQDGLFLCGFEQRVVAFFDCDEYSSFNGLKTSAFNLWKEVAKTSFPESSFTYADLEGLPCFLVVVEKARVGDTLPSSFVVLDLRLRTNDDPKSNENASSSSFRSSVVQELGRLCKFDSIYRWVLVTKKLYSEFRKYKDDLNAYSRTNMKRNENEESDSLLSPFSLFMKTKVDKFVKQVTGWNKSLNETSMDLRIKLLSVLETMNLAPLCLDFFRDIFATDQFGAIQRCRFLVPTNSKVSGAQRDSYDSISSTHIEYFDSASSWKKFYFPTGDECSSDKDIIIHRRWTPSPRLMFSAQPQAGKTTSYLWAAFLLSRRIQRFQSADRYVDEIDLFEVPNFVELERFEEDKLKYIFADSLNPEECYAKGEIEFWKKRAPSKYVQRIWCERVQLLLRFLQSNTLRTFAHIQKMIDDLESASFCCSLATDRFHNLDINWRDVQVMISLEQNVSVSLISTKTQSTAEKIAAFLNYDNLLSLTSNDGLLNVPKSEVYFSESLSSSEYSFRSLNQFIEDHIEVVDDDVGGKLEGQEETSRFSSPNVAYRSGRLPSSSFCSPMEDISHDNYMRKKFRLDNYYSSGTSTPPSCSPNIVCLLNPNVFNYSLVQKSRVYKIGIQSVENLRLHVPPSMNDLMPTLANTLDVSNFSTLPGAISNIPCWIFSISHREGGIERCRFDFRDSCWSKIKLFHCIFVRRSKFDEYVQIWGSGSFIMEIPEEMTLSYQSSTDFSADCHPLPRKVRLRDDVHRHGYARLFAQLFARYCGINQAIFLDDNVIDVHFVPYDELFANSSSAGSSCAKVEVWKHAPFDLACRRLLVALSPTTFLGSHNGISIERLKQFFKLESQALSREIKFDDIVDKVISRRFDRNPVVVGMSRRWLKCSAIRTTSSVYSFFAMNLNACWDERQSNLLKLYFPPRGFREDIEFCVSALLRGHSVASIPFMIHRKDYTRFRPVTAEDDDVLFADKLQNEILASNRGFLIQEWDESEIDDPAITLSINDSLEPIREVVQDLDEILSPHHDSMIRVYPNKFSDLDDVIKRNLGWFSGKNRILRGKIKDSVGLDKKIALVWLTSLKFKGFQLGMEIETIIAEDMSSLLDSISSSSDKEFAIVKRMNPCRKYLLSKNISLRSGHECSLRFLLLVRTEPAESSPDIDFSSPQPRIRKRDRDFNDTLTFLHSTPEDKIRSRLDDDSNVSDEPEQKRSLKTRIPFTTRVKLMSTLSPIFEAAARGTRYPTEKRKLLIEKAISECELDAKKVKNFISNEMKNHRPEKAGDMVPRIVDLD